MTMPETLDIPALRSVIRDAKEIVKRYRNLTGKPLGVTGEVGEFTAAESMNLRLTGARQPGYDAVASDGHRRIQIKARCILPESKKSQHLGSIRLKHEWDTVMLILMDADFEPLEIYEAKRSDIERELNKPGSKARNVRGSLSVGKFRSIALRVWSKPTQLDILRSKFVRR
jgi:hypothetical protein